MSELFPYLLSAAGGGSMKTGIAGQGSRQPSGDGIAASSGSGAGVGIGGGGGGDIDTDEYYGNFNVHTSNV